MNTVRTNFTTCCRYPVLVVWKFNYNLCVSECKNKNLEDSMYKNPHLQWSSLILKIFSCCILGCSFEKSDLFRRIYRGYLTSSPNGVYASFMLSVGNDTNWASTVRESVNQCYTKLAVIEKAFLSVMLTIFFTGSFLRILLWWNRTQGLLSFNRLRLCDNLQKMSLVESQPSCSLPRN